MRPLGDAPVWALGIDTCEEEAELPVHPPPYRTHRRLIARGEEDGALVAARRGTGTGDPQGGQVDLDGDGAPFLVSRRNRAPTNGARPCSEPEIGIRKLAAGPTVPSRNSPLRTPPNATDALATASRAWI